MSSSYESDVDIECTPPNFRTEDYFRTSAFSVSTETLNIIFIMFYSVPQSAGLVEVLIRKFRAAGSVVVAYVVASVVLHAVWLLEKWADPQSVSTPLLIVLFTLQRCLSPWYYFFSKRAALRVSDPRFYEDMDWINQQLQR